MNNIENIYKFADSLACETKLDEPMKKHTSFKIGGNAAVYIKVDSLSKLCKFVRECKLTDTKYFLLGNGSNILVDDNGMDCAVIKLDGDFKEIRMIDSETVYCGAGATLAALCKFALNNSLSGLEFAWGIPGSVGGAAFMNAGAYGGEMKDVLYKCEHIDKNGDIGFLEYDDLKLSYRHSAYYDNGAIITGLYLKLKKGEKSEIKEKMDDLIGRRRAKQPLEYPSAGSTFKRPEGYFAGALIEQCNLKGKSVGGAQVSEKHAGFVINKGGATCKDVLDLCKYCSDKVMEETGVKLEMEIRVTK